MQVTALEPNTDVASMETVIERLLHKEQYLKDKNQGSLLPKDGKEEAMSVKHKKRGLRYDFWNKFGHI